MNRHALITGGSQNIGLAIARAFLSKDIPVTLVARNADKLHRAQQELENEYRAAVTYASVDITKPGEVEDVIENILGDQTELYMINNAGTFELITPEMTYEQAQSVFERMMDQHFRAPSRIANYLLGRFSIAPDSTLHLLNVSSQAAIRPELSGNRGYGTAKAAMQAFTHRIEAEYAEYPNIHVYSVLPGIVETPEAIKLWKSDPTIFGEPTSYDSITSLVLDLVGLTTTSTPYHHAYVGNVQNDHPPFIPADVKGIVRAYFTDTHRFDRMVISQIDPRYRCNL